MKRKSRSWDDSDLESVSKPYESYTGQKWYPSGWTYNERTGLWDPPDYLSQESEEKWRWDEEKRIWIDKEKEARLKRYQERRAKEGQPPSFEEWKAAQLSKQKEAKE